jgi:hypothetical protein
MLVLGALGIGCSYATLGPLAAHAAPTATASSVPATALATTRIAYGHAATVTGHLADAQRGEPVTLQFEPAGSTTWANVATTTSGAGGSYRLAAKLNRSGILRVAAGGATASAASLAGANASGGQAIEVAARVAAAVRQPDQLAGHAVTVSGIVQTPQPGRTVVLQERRGRRWINLARARTNAKGRYLVRFTPQGIGSHALRVRFDGDKLNAPAGSWTTVANIYRLAGASWYGPGGSLACGGSLTDSTMGVANKTLPCGTMVTLHLGSHTVRVPVIDRGPYVAGRDYDLTPATKRALGFGDTGTIWATA